MKSTVSISEGGNHFPALIRAAEKGVVFTVTRRGTPVACVVGYDRMVAIAETMETLGNPAAAAAIQEHRSGRTTFGTLDEIDA